MSEDMMRLIEEGRRDLQQQLEEKDRRIEQLEESQQQLEEKDRRIEQLEENQVQLKENQARFMSWLAEQGLEPPDFVQV